MRRPTHRLNRGAILRLTMADDTGRRLGTGLPPMLEGDVIISPEDVRVGYPPQCTQIDEGAVKNLAFLNAMKPEEAQKYMGEWIAVADGEIVAHGKDPGLVCQEGRKAGKGGPHMRYIYAKPEEVPWLYVPKQ